MGKKGKDHQGTCIKDTWTKPKEGYQGKEARIGGAGESNGGKWGQL